jgi:hypothetical protein
MDDEGMAPLTPTEEQKAWAKTVGSWLPASECEKKSNQLTALGEGC